MASAWGNCVSLPIVLLEPIIENWGLARADPDASRAQALNAVGLYLIVWFGTLMSVGKKYLQWALSEPAAAHKHRSALRSSSPSATRALTSPSPSSSPQPLRRGIPLRTTPTLRMLEMTDIGHETIKPESAPDGQTPEVQRQFTFASVDKVRSSAEMATGARAALCGVVSVLDPVTTCILVAVIVGVIEPLRTVLSPGHALSWVGSALTSLGATGAVLNVIVLGASLYMSTRTGKAAEVKRVAEEPQSTVQKRAPRGSVTTPALHLEDPPATPFTIDVVLEDPPAPPFTIAVVETADARQRMTPFTTEDDAKSSTGNPTAPRRERRHSSLSTLDMPIELAITAEDGSGRRAPCASGPATITIKPCHQGSKPIVTAPAWADPWCGIFYFPLHYRLVVAMLLARLVLVPAIALPLTVFAARQGLVPNEPLLLLMCHLMSAVPSASSLVSMLNAFGHGKLAGQISKLYLPQYICSVLTMTVVIAVAIQTIEANPVATTSLVLNQTVNHTA